MTQRPVIAIAPTHLPAQGDIRLAQNYADSVIAAGGAPLILPLTSDADVYGTLFPLIDGVLLTGGDDVDPARYGAAPLDGLAAEHPVTPLRDAVEWRLIAHALEHGLPVLGICRGEQILNAYLGGTLYQDLPRAFSPAGAQGLCCHDLRDAAGGYDGDHAAHEVSIASGSLLESVLGMDELPVNSLHHQAVHAVAPGLAAVAWAPDGVIEAVEAVDGRPLLAVQWHPEYFGGDDPHRRLFHWLVDEAARHRR